MEQSQQENKFFEALKLLWVIAGFAAVGFIIYVIVTTQP